MRVVSTSLVAVCLLMAGSAVLAGEVKIVDAEVRANKSGTYAFSVTLRHDDTGWDHYADRWEVLSPAGTVLGSRVLLHPHENEQPFTHSLSGIRVPSGIREVRIRAHDKVHGDGPVLFAVPIPGH